MFVFIFNLDGVDIRLKEISYIQSLEQYRVFIQRKLRVVDLREGVGLLKVANFKGTRRDERGNVYLLWFATGEEDRIKKILNGGSVKGKIEVAREEKFEKVALYDDAYLAVQSVTCSVCGKRLLECKCKQHITLFLCSVVLGYHKEGKYPSNLHLLCFIFFLSLFFFPFSAMQIRLK